MDNQRDKALHEIKLSARKHLEINGVKDVVSFDEENVLLKTVCGEMNIDGSGIKMSVLDTDRGIVVIDGRIDSIYYSDERGEEKRGFLGRMFG